LAPIIGRSAYGAEPEVLVEATGAVNDRVDDNHATTTETDCGQDGLEGRGEELAAIAAGGATVR
jgi:hypothetical protein